MRVKALLFAAGLAVATAGTAAANPQDTCDGKAWLSKIVCEAQHDAAKAQAAPAEESDAFDWFRDALDQLGSKTMISSSVRPSTSPAATAPSDATRRKDGTVAGTRSP